ncbi:MAG: DUF5317 domain-containing protein [Clostridium sp.]|nr:DUF5317 domain-containing protein [Clostridium sp.]
MLALLYSWHKKLNIKLLFESWPIYLPLCMLCLYIIAEILIFNDQYWITQYGSQIKQITLLSYLGLVLKYKLYDSENTNQSELKRFLTSPFIIAIICLVIGYSMNFIAITMNSGHMPVFPSTTYFTGYTDSSSFTKDSFYVLGDSTSKAIPLCDIYDIYYSNLSLGDVFVRCYVFLLIYHSIRRINKNIK